MLNGEQFHQGVLPLGPATSRQTAPVDFVHEGAQRYAASKGLRYSAEGLDQTQVDPARGHRQWLAYRDAQAARTERPGIRRSYEAMRQHVGEQHAFMTAPVESGGLGIKHEVSDSDPYPDVESMVKDVRENRRIKTYPTAATGGHEFFSNAENDQFRAVHDVFGHAAIGRGFSRHGEEAAYRSHMQMFPPEAHAALASETRGQNSYVNFNPGGTDFPDQSPGSKLIGMPSWANGTRRMAR